MSFQAAFTLTAFGLLAGAAAAQTPAVLPGPPNQLTPVQKDYTFHENEDGSIVTADVEGPTSSRASSTT